MLRIQQLKMPIEHSKTDLYQKAAIALGIRKEEISALHTVRRSVDARKKPDIYYNYILDVEVKKEDKVLKRKNSSQVIFFRPEQYCFPMSGREQMKERPVIAGTGPAGLFCGYFLALHGYRPILLERGADVDTRMRDVAFFWDGGKLNEQSNVQFGEGGAGTFSDGKLNTLIKDKLGRSKVVLETFVAFGASEDILYDAKPHLGTDVLCDIVKGIRLEIKRLGGEVRFHSKLTGICLQDGRLKGIIVNGTEEIPCSQAVLAIGHSARDTAEMLYEKDVPMEAKAFAVGLRVEHPQRMINVSQYGREEPGKLGPAAYKVTASAFTKRGVYSFCMCPGGYVVNASSERGRLAVNGMSYSGRGGENANSAIIVSVTPDDFDSAHPLAGISFQRKLEEKAFALGQGQIPMQRYGEYKRCVAKRTAGQLKGMERDILTAQCGFTGEIIPAHKGAGIFTDLSDLFSEEISLSFIAGMEQFGRQIPGFNREDTLLSGVESRTSSPVRILREEDLQSKIKGLYPCGEGAGYAGGITSAAMDGIRVAEAIAARYMPSR